MKKQFLWIFTLLIFCFFFVTPNGVFAQVFSDSYIRLQRQVQQHNPGSVLVVFSPTGSQTESTLKVDVGSGWQVSANPSTITVATTSLPQGVLPVPGISTATAVNGNTVSFSTNDLISGQTYGFYITGGIGNNPNAGAAEEHLWQISTLTAAESIINQTEIMVPTVQNDQIVVTGEVAPLSYYFSTDLQSDASGTIVPNQEIEYTITYSSNLSQSTPLTIEAEWSLGTIQGESVADTEILEYVVGSASQAYGSTPAVIDTVNRTITWEISSIPANTVNETVTFSLRATDAYSGSMPVNFFVRSRIIDPAATSYSQVNQIYENSEITPTPTPSGTQTPTPTPSASTITATSTPTPEPGEIPSPIPQPYEQTRLTTEIFHSFFIKEISQDSVSLLIDLNRSADVQVRYGKSLDTLSNFSTLSTNKSLHTLQLNNLEPGIRYYFQILVFDNSTTYISDLFTFETSDAVLPESFFVTSVQAVSQNFPLVTVQNRRNDIYYSQNVPKLIQESILEVFFEFSEIDGATEVFFYFVPEQIKSANSSYGYLHHYQRTALTKINSSTYGASFEIPKGPGLYTAYLQVRHSSGNVIELPAFPIYVSRPVLILDTQTQQPVEGVRGTFYLFDTGTQTYKRMQNFTFLESNPLYTDYFGNLEFILPDGKYRIELDAIGYLSEEVDLTIDSRNHKQYPVIGLTPTAVSLFEKFTYHSQTVTSLFSEVHAIFSSRLPSQKFRETVEFAILLIFAIVSVLSLSVRTRMSIRSLFNYWKNHVLFHSLSLTKKHVKMHGQVISKETQKPIAGASVLLINKRTQAEVVEVKSNNSGTFQVLLPMVDIEYIVSAPGYIVQTGEIQIAADVSEKNIIEVELETHESLIEKAEKGILFSVQNIFGVFFELIIILSIVMQIAFISELGFWRVAPFLVLSVVNVWTWLVYLYTRRNF